MNNIVLIGFMGSGKTTFGRWVSRRHNRKFYDTDEYIEKKQNTTISEIFATKGEEAFRDMETETVKELSDTLDNCVISVGGGLVLREVNRELLRKLGTVVYLKASEEELCKARTPNVHYYRAVGFTRRYITLWSREKIYIWMRLI